MFKLTMKNLRANKVRFALTTFGVMLAVSFVVSAFVLGDGLRSSFGDVSEEVTAGIDLQVRPVTDFGDPRPLPASLVDVVAQVEGVADAVPEIEAPWDAIQVIGGDGEPITTIGPPQIAQAWSDNASLSPFTLVEGASPGIGEFTVDLDSAADNDLIIGQAYEIATPSGRVSLVLSGTSTFGTDNETLGALLVQFNEAEAAGLLDIDGVNTISVQVADGADPVEVQAAIASAIPDVEVVDHETVASESSEEFTGEIDIVGNILLGFGGVSLFVSIFIIYNTFAIVLGQRTQELGLLRTIGADPKQIRRSVLGEAFVVGVLASAGGIAGGIGVARGLEALFNTMGGSLPESPTIIAPRTIIAAVVIGLGVTMLAAFGPARKASTIPAIAAIRGGEEATSPGSRTRVISGLGLLATGLTGGLTGLAGAGGTATTVTLMAVGAIGIFLGTTLLSPMAVGPITRILGWPMARLSGVAGTMARQNAARNPRRTATTAAALMIGLALVSTALVVGQSIKENVGTTLAESATADYFMTDQLTDVEFPLGAADELAAIDAVESFTGYRYVETKVDGVLDTNVAADFDQMASVLNADVRTGDLGMGISNPVLISADHAESSGLGIGDVVTTEFASGSFVDSTITGVFHDKALIESDFLFDESTFDAAGDQTGYEWFGLNMKDSASAADIDAAVAGLQDRFLVADIETSEQFVDRIEGLIGETLAIVNVMVALAVVIALIGIANTLALSVFERTRELGLVRAVGMTRRQLRRMVRFEAALVATFGAVLGVAIGLLFGWGVVTALPDSFASTLAIPFQSIAVLVIVAAMAGVLAAVLPARRAGRLNVLDAVSY
jgi:putative ABC transport system permease protein